MKKVNLASIRFYRSILLISIGLSIAVSACTPEWIITNPYEQVDWQNHRQYKANLHTHTTKSDGGLAPQMVVDRYHQLGYNILAITDHNEVTYPWTEFASMEASKKSEQKVADGALSKENINYENRDPETLGMIAIQGNEVSAPHHIGSLFNDYNHPTKQEDSAFVSIAAKDGLVIINHPGRYKHNAQWYIDFYKKYKHLIGMEIYNQGDRYPSDRQLWDPVLVALLPARTVWAYSNDDMHREKSIGRNWNIFVLPELSEEWVRKGIEKGHSFYCYSPEGHNNSSLPTIHSVLVRKQKGQIQIDATGQDSIRWISGGKIVQKGGLIKLNDCRDLSTYVRAEIYGANGFIMGTQPFLIQKKQPVPKTPKP